MLQRCSGVALSCVLLAIAGGCGNQTPGESRQVSTEIPASLRFAQPLQGQLSLTDSILVELALSRMIAIEHLEVTLDGEDITTKLSATGESMSGKLTNIAAGTHRLTAEGSVAGHMLRATTTFETVALENPAECEVLNNAACLLPYPSSRFLRPDGTRTGYRVDFPLAGMPRQSFEPLDPTPYFVLDGFSPAAQILMHFPAGVDLTPTRSESLFSRALSDGDGAAARRQA